MGKKQKLFLIWTIFLLLGPAIVLLNTNFVVVGTNKILITNVFQRVLGLTAFFLLAFQILFKDKIKTSFHKLNGMLTYTFVFLHPTSWIIYNFFLRGNIDIYYPFIDVCGLCKPTSEYFINLGRLGFWSITFAVLATRLVTLINDKWLTKNWKNVHMLNYLAFYFISIHTIFLGTDATNPLFIAFFGLCQILVLVIIVKKLKRIDLKKIIKLIFF